MKRTAIVSAVMLFLLAGCGSDSGKSGRPETASGDASSASTASAAPSATPTPTPAEPEYGTLSKADLTDALLDIQDLPAGYSQDPPSQDGPDKTFCNYKAPFNAPEKTSRGFTKGVGLSGQVLSVGLRQYKNADQAEAAFDALNKALETCHTETYQGSKMTYALMSAPKVGDGTVGVRITGDNTTALQNFALVGPTLVNTGAGGLMDVNADQVAGLLEDQVNVYQTAATK